MATVTNTIKLPDGSTPASASVEIELVASNAGTTGAAAWVDATDVTVLSTSRPTVTNGAWAADLTPNANIDPSGTAYRVTEYVGRQRYVHHISVGSGGGALHDLLVDAPSSVPSSALQSHLDDGTAAHAASAISYAGSTSLAAVNVEAALDELDAEKAPLATGVPSGGATGQVLRKSSSSNYAMAWRTPTLLGPTFMIVGDAESERYESWPWLVTVRSGGRITLTQHLDSSAGSATAASSIDTFMQWQVPTPPSFTVICLGYIDLVTITVAEYITNMKALIAAVEAAGSVPVLTTVMPRTVADSNYTVAIRSKVAAACMWIKNYAALAGYPMVDFYGMLADPLTGVLKTQYQTSAQYNQVAARDLADLFISTMQHYLRPWKGIEAAWDGDTNNLIPNGLTLPDSNSDGVPDGWTLQFPGSGSTLSVVSDSRFKGGKAMQLAESSPSTVPQVKSPNVTASVSPGDTIAFTCSYSIESASGITDVPENVGLMAYALTPAVLQLFSYHQVNGADGALNTFTGLIYFPLDSSPQPTLWSRENVGFMFRINGLGAGDAMTVRVGDFGIFNLTDMGVVEPGLGYAAGAWGWHNIYTANHSYWLPGS